MKKIVTFLHDDLDNDLPKVQEDESGFLRSDTVIIIGKDHCRWLAFWDEEDNVWRNSNTSDKIYMNKEYVVAWIEIPLYIK